MSTKIENKTLSRSTAVRSQRCADLHCSGLSDFAKELLGAIRALAKDYVPHPCGGYNIDDMRWRLGKFFEPDETMYEAIDELSQARLIRYMGEDDETAYICCYGPNAQDHGRLPAKGNDDKTTTQRTI
jgi:hypothetical protein